MKNQGIIKTFLLLLLSLTIVGCNQKKDNIIQLTFVNENSSLSDSINTINSFKRNDKFFILNYTCEYDSYVDWLQNYFNSIAGIDFKPGQSGCSVFYASSDTEKNFLSQNVDSPSCTPLFGKYSSHGKYKSFAFSRIEDMKGFDKGIDPSNLTNDQKTSLLFFPFYSVGGINEYGLAVGIAGIPSQLIKDTLNKEPIYVTNFMRQILDNCKTVDEAIKFSTKYYIYDHSLSTNSHHFLIGDSFGKSVILEYANGKLDYKFEDKRFQLFTNNPVIEKSMEDLSQCWRYKTLNKKLTKINPETTNQDYLTFLNDAKNNTNWSVVYDLNEKRGIFTIYGDFSKRYKFNFD